MTNPKRQRPICHLTVCAERMIGDWTDERIELEACAKGSKNLDLEELEAMAIAAGWRVTWYRTGTFFPKAPAEALPEVASA